MTNIFKLVKKTENSKHWGPKDVLEEALAEVNSGEIGENDRLIVISVNPANTGNFDTHFIQCGMSASDMIMLLDIAKMDIYRKQMTPKE